MTIYQDHALIPPNPKLALVSYIRDYKLVKIKNMYHVKYAKFYEDSWHDAMKFSIARKDIVKYLKDTNKKESIIRVANGLINTSGFMPGNRALYLVISDRIEQVKNIERMIRS